MFGLSLLLFALLGVHGFFLILFVFIYIYWCPKQFPYQIMLVTLNSNTTGVTCGTVTANPSGVPEFTLGFSRVRVVRSLVFCVVFWGLSIVLSVLRFTDSDYPVGIFKLFLFIHLHNCRYYMHSYGTVSLNGLFPCMYTCGNSDHKLRTGLSWNINLFIEYDLLILEMFQQCSSFVFHYFLRWEIWLLFVTPPLSSAILFREFQTFRTYFGKLWKIQLIISGNACAKLSAVRSPLSISKRFTWFVAVKGGHKAELRTFILFMIFNIKMQR